jgi:hypothetical protein
MTAINVLGGSRAMRDRLKSFNVCMDGSIGSQRTMDAISTPPPIASSIMGFEDEVEQSLPRPCRSYRQVQADMRTHLIHRPARDILPPLGGARASSYRIDPERPYAAAVSLIQRNSVPSVQMRCIMMAKRRDSATIAFFTPRCLAIFIAQALSQDHLAERNSMTWAAS